MQVSAWYHVDEKLPAKSGTYITFVGSSLGSDEAGPGTSFYDARFQNHGSRWRDSLAPHSAWVNVVYWCDADTWEWYNNTYAHTEPSAALHDAWNDIQRAISRYEMIKVLSAKAD